MILMGTSSFGNRFIRRSLRELAEDMGVEPERLIDQLDAADREQLLDEARRIEERRRRAGFPQYTPRSDFVGGIRR